MTVNKNAMNAMAIRSHHVENEEFAGGIEGSFEERDA